MTALWSTVLTVSLTEGPLRVVNLTTRKQYNLQDKSIGHAR